MLDLKDQKSSYLSLCNAYLNRIKFRAFKIDIKVFK